MKEKDYNDIQLLNDKQSNEVVLIQKTVKTTIQIVYDKGFFDSFPNADKVSKFFLFVTRRTLDLEKADDNVI